MKTMREKVVRYELRRYYGSGESELVGHYDPVGNEDTDMKGLKEWMQTELGCIKEGFVLLEDA